MRIVFVSPRSIDTPTHPLGILYLAAVLLKEKHEVKIIDPNFDDAFSKTALEVMGFKPDFVGFTATTPQVDLGLKIAAEIKKLNSKMPVIFGGAHPTVLPADVLGHSVVDVVAKGEGEKIILNIVKAVAGEMPWSQVKGIGWKNNGEIVFNPPETLIENLDTIPFPARQLLNSRYYYAPPRIRGLWTRATATVMASRGCPYKCIWCSSHTVFGYRVRYRSPENVMQELTELVENVKVDSVSFIDDTFTINVEFVKEICRRIREKKWKNFRWACQARVDTISEELLTEMKKAGCVQLDFGVESGSPKILANLKKHISIEKVKEAFRICRKVGVQSFASFMIGSPGETKEDILMTLELVKEIRPGYTDFFYATPYPGTEFFDIVVDRKALPDNLSYINWYVGRQTDKPAVHLDSTEDEIIKYRSMLYNTVFLRNYLTLLRNPAFILGGLKIMIIGFPGLLKGLGRFFKTGKIDSIFVEVLINYRRKLKQKTQK